MLFSHRLCGGFILTPSTALSYCVKSSLYTFKNQIGLGGGQIL